MRNESHTAMPVKESHAFLWQPRGHGFERVTNERRARKRPSRRIAIDQRYTHAPLSLSHSLHIFFFPHAFYSTRLAIKYIKHLQYLLSFPDGQKIPPHIVEFDPTVAAWVKGKSMPGAVTISDLEQQAQEQVSHHQ